MPPTKPVLSSPGSYMSAYNSHSGSGSPAAGAPTVAAAPPPVPTAGIHSVNKSHEKPAIAARPIPPPTLPKYSSSFSKGDRDRNEFVGKIDRADREKVLLLFAFCCLLVAHAQLAAAVEPGLAEEGGYQSYAQPLLLHIIRTTLRARISPELETFVCCFI